MAGKSHHSTKDLSSMSGMDKDTIMYAAVAGVLLIGAGLLIAIRRRAARRNSGITQV
jgi:LPXTG-motif cell wall-anchored protein